jgi:hypothetical protein
LARNREAARRSRKKKKEYVALMEYKVLKLTEEVSYLRNLKKEREAAEMHQEHLQEFEEGR